MEASKPEWIFVAVIGLLMWGTLGYVATLLRYEHNWPRNRLTLTKMWLFCLLGGALALVFQLILEAVKALKKNGGAWFDIWPHVE